MADEIDQRLINFSEAVKYLDFRPKLRINDTIKSNYKWNL